ncbi:MAG: hypothetical protein RLZZ135_1586 [Cyanobacteriota bacterium]|jgi:hypothetical protein
MAENPTEKKGYTEFVILRRIAMRIHNPQVIAAYTHRLDGTDGEHEIARLLYDNLQIKTQDTFNAIILRILIFYLLCARLATSSTVPMWWTVKSEKFSPQLVISFRPAERRKLKFGKYDSNLQLHIPHYNGDEHPKIPSYTIGHYTAKYILKDQTYILVNAHSEEEAISVVEKLVNYVIESKRASGKVLDNISTTKRRGKPLSLTDRLVVPFRADYYKKGDAGYVKEKVYQL